MSEQGYCQVASQTVRATRAECEEIGGNWTEDDPHDCVVATAAVGSADDLDIIYLRTLRDRIVERDSTAADMWRRYSPTYYRMAVPVVAQMQADPVLRRLIGAFVVEPALQALRTMAIHLDPASDDAQVRDTVREGIVRFKAKLSSLDEEGGDGLAASVLATLAEIGTDMDRARFAPYGKGEDRA